MFDTETFIREVMKRPALYSSRARESGENKNHYWEEIGQVIYKEWPALERPEERLDRIRELRKKWKSVRDNFLRDMKAPSSRKKRYIYHDLMTFLIPHLDPRRWHSPAEDDVSDGDYRPSRSGKKKKKDLIQQEQEEPQDFNDSVAEDFPPDNKEFLLSLAPLMDDLAGDDLARVRQEVTWTMEAVGQCGRERRLISLVENCPALWEIGQPYSGDSGEEETLWIHIAHEARLSVDDCKKMWGDLVADLKRHLEKPEPREKWKYEDEMSFCIPYLLQQRSESTSAIMNTDSKNSYRYRKKGSRILKQNVKRKHPGITNLKKYNGKRRSMYLERQLDSVKKEVELDIPMEPGAIQSEDEEEEGRLPVELCQVECPTSPSDQGNNDTLTDFFINMARTVATFPPRLQAHVKAEVFRAVNTAEINLQSAPLIISQPMTIPHNVHYQDAALSLRSSPMQMSSNMQEVPQPNRTPDTGRWNANI